MPDVSQNSYSKDDSLAFEPSEIAANGQGYRVEIARQVLKDVLDMIGDLDHLTLPNGIRPHLVALIEASNIEFFQSHPDAYWELYSETAELCRQGWRSFNYWISLEQMTCYKLYWEFKRVADKYQQPLMIPTPLDTRTRFERALDHFRVFFGKIAKFVHLHDLEYYRSNIAQDDEQPKDPN